MHDMCWARTVHVCVCVCVCVEGNDGSNNVYIVYFVEFCFSDTIYPNARYSVCLCVCVCVCVCALLGGGRRQCDGDPSPDTPCAESEKMEAESGGRERGGEGGGGRERGGEGPPDSVGRGDRDGEGGGGVGGGSESSDDLPQPISLADLQTFEEDATSLTRVTSCTGYLTQLVTTDDDGDSQMAATLGGQPLHSTVAPQDSTWNPLTTDPLHQGAPRFRLPSIREISRINGPLAHSATDSGVAVASSDFNQPPGASLTNSGGAGGGEINTGTPKHPESNNGEKEVDSGLVPSPDHAHTEEEIPREMGGVTRPGLRPLNVPPSTPFTLPQSTSVTPSRYSTIQMYRNRLGMPLAVTQKSIFTNHRPIFCSSHSLLPSQLRLTPTQSSSSSSPRSGVTACDRAAARTPSKTGFYYESLAGRTSPVFPEEVIRKKASLKAQLQFYSESMDIQ